MLTYDTHQPIWEPVWTMTSDYDGPLEGVASFGGTPQVYCLDWEDLKEETSIA